MESALLIINEKLKEAGMKQTEIDYLLARFLEEEALEYVKTMNKINHCIEMREKGNAVIN